MHLWQPAPMDCVSTYCGHVLRLFSAVFFASRELCRHHAAGQTLCSFPCVTGSEYCDPVVRECLHCEDICAPQYVDSRIQCREWCPSYKRVAERVTVKLSGMHLQTTQLSLSMDDDSVGTVRSLGCDECRLSSCLIGLGVAVTLSIVMTSFLCLAVHRLGIIRRNVTRDIHNDDPPEREPMSIICSPQDEEVT